MLITFSVFWLLIPCFAENAEVTTGSIRGDVFTKTEGEEPFLFPGARVALYGPVAKETQADEKGDYVFDSVPPGTYTVKAQAPGLSASFELEVKAGGTTVAPLELRVDEVKSTVTVTAEAPSPVAESSQNTTINQSTVEIAPNHNERFESLLPLVPGVLRGPDGRINMKGARSTQSGWLVNSANVTDPATGSEAINLPIDVVSSVQVISNPYDPEYGKFTGAISSVETRIGNLENFHISVQNVIPRARVRDGDVVGIESFTPRVTVTGPLVKDKIAFTQSIEYRFVRTPVQSLPPMQRDTKLESFDSFSQMDLKISQSQTATVTFADFPQKLAGLGLNTFTPQPSTSDLHERGYQGSFQHRYITESGGLVSSQVTYESFDADVLPNSTDPYRLLVETTTGGFFDRQRRQSDRVEWQEMYESGPRHFHGTHQIKAGADFSHSSYDGHRQFLPVDIVGTSGYAIEQIQFGAPAIYSVHQNEFAWFVGDQWTPASRLSFDLGLRFDRDSITDSTHAAPRAGLTLALTGDRRTLLKAGAGLFYDRVPLNIPTFPLLPDRTILMLDPAGQVLSSTPYANVISGGLRNPRSTAWNVELDRQVSTKLLVRAAYQQRNTTNSFVVMPTTTAGSALLSLSNSGSDSYREFQLTGVYQARRYTLNASYVRSRAYGDLNDFNQFFGNNPQPIIQPDARARLPFDAPNRFLTWGEIRGPKKITLMPVLDLHTGFPYSTENQMREFVGPRNDQRFPRFVSFDLQVQKAIRLPLSKNHRAKVGFGVFNLFNHFDPRDVQNDLDSYRFGALFNGVPRTFRGKFVVDF
jgi:hypothetical protein